MRNFTKDFVASDKATKDLFAANKISFPNKISFSADMQR